MSVKSQSDPQLAAKRSVYLNLLSRWLTNKVIILHSSSSKVVKRVWMLALTLAKPSAFPTILHSKGRITYLPSFSEILGSHTVIQRALQQAKTVIQRTLQQAKTVIQRASQQANTVIGRAPRQNQNCSRWDEIQQNQRDETKQNQRDEKKQYQKDEIKQNQRDEIKQNQRDKIKQNPRDEIKQNQKDEIKQNQRDEIKQNQRDEIKQFSSSSPS